MSQMIGGTSAPASWKGIKSIDEATNLIDLGVMLRWRDMRTLTRQYSLEDQEKVVRHFAKRLVERSPVRLQAEILVESALIWLANAAEEKLLHAFLEQLFAEAGCDQACWVIVEVALTSEVSEQRHSSDIFEMAVALICELGINVQEYDREFPGDFAKAQGLLDHIATYLLSVSNANSSCIRLSLVHYFGVTEHETAAKPYFNRIMSRFGHTVLDHLFALLFRKKSEAVALQFLLENLPFVLGADRHSQKIVHETFKHYMLKEPERFSLFIQAFTKELLHQTDATYDIVRQVFLQHLGLMVRVASEVNHKQLGREFLVAITRFEHVGFCREMIQALLQDQDLRKTFRDLLTQLKGSSSSGPAHGPDSVTQFRSSKRGRKPSFSRTEGMGTLHQVHYLGAIDLQKAS